VKGIANLNLKSLRDEFLSKPPVRLIVNMKCPRCKSTQLRKNGHSSGKQRYLCKACGKQFLEPLSSPQLPSSESDAVQVASNENSEPALAQAVLPIVNVPEALEHKLDRAEASTQSAQGIAILLLDAENLRLDINAEKFLTGLCNYPLQVKIAFANWRNFAVGKLDTELYERGYQLIHVPLGQNSADAQMIAMGASISRHYPDAKEVFVCSSDWLLTNLCNELQSQGMTVYRVRRQDNILSVENRNTGESRQYSLTIETEIPSFEEFIEKIEELIHSEHKSITERIGQLSTVAALFKERRNLTFNSNRNNGVLLQAQNQDLIAPVVEQKSTLPLPEKADVQSNTSVTTISNPSIRTINSKEELELALVEIIESMKVNDPLGEISVSKLSAALQKAYNETGNSIIKKLKLSTNFTKFLQSCPTFKVEKIGKIYEVVFAKDSSTKLNSPKELEQLLVKVMKVLQSKSPQKPILLESLGIEFHKQYRKPVSAIIKRFNRNDSFVEFVQSCSAFKVEKKGTGYQVSLAQS
jgi:hypothetical protein